MPIFVSNSREVSVLPEEQKPVRSGALILHDMFYRLALTLGTASGFGYFINHNPILATSFGLSLAVLMGNFLLGLQRGSAQQTKDNKLLKTQEEGDKSRQALTVLKELELKKSSAGARSTPTSTPQDNRGSFIVFKN